MSRRRASAAPFVFSVLAGAAVAFFLLPLVGLLVRAPWSQLGEQLASAAIADALWLSVRCSFAAVVVSCVLGLPLSVWLARGSARRHTFVRVLVTLPMVLPPVVGGVAMLFAFGRNGFVGAPLHDLFGVAFPFTTAGVVLAEAYVAMPFFVLTVEGGLRSLDPRYEEAAATLGAGPWRVFWTVTLPMIGPSLGAGLLVAWARALGEFGATITFAGNLQGETRTMPLAVYVALENAPEAAITLSLVLVAIAASVLFVLRKQWFPGTR